MEAGRTVRRQVQEFQQEMWCFARGAALEVMGNVQILETFWWESQLVFLIMISTR